MKSSFENLHSRVDDIEQMNLRLGGLVDVFVKLPEEDQIELLKDIKRLKESSEKGNEAALLEKIKAMIAFYGVILERVETGKQNEEERPLAVTLEELLKNFEGLGDKKNPSWPENTVN